MRISQPNYGKVLERGTFMKEYQLERLSEGAPCGCPLSPGARGFAHPEPIGVTPLLPMTIKRICDHCKAEIQCGEDSYKTL